MMKRYEAILSYIPPYYQTSNVFNAILGSEGAELDLLRQNIDDLKAQFFIDTATWGLKFWEKEYGLQGNESLTYEERRSMVKGKKRGTGKVGSTLIKSVAEAYANGEVSVTFDEDIKVTFIGTRGIPSAIEELKKQLEEIIPAHKSIQYVFLYTTWAEVRNATWERVKTGTWGELKTRSVI